MERAVVVDKRLWQCIVRRIGESTSSLCPGRFKLDTQHFITEEEIISGCQGAIAILATGNPPITRKVMEALPQLKYVQRLV